MFLALAIPSERILPLRGLEWSFMNLTGSKYPTSSIELQKKNDEQDTDNLL